jgi:hypothetical protein
LVRSRDSTGWRKTTTINWASLLAIGSYLVGAAVMVFRLNAEMPPELKLFFIVFTCGKLTYNCI